MKTGKNFNFAIGVAFISALTLSGCGGAAPSDPNASTSTGTTSPVSLTSPPNPGGVTLVASPSTIVSNSTTTLYAYGGTAPYFFTMSGGTGTVNYTTGVFTAPAIAETDTVRVQDSANGTATATITITTSSITPNTLQISPSTVTVGTGQTNTFSASGGVQPYSYSVISGSGTMSGAIYTAPSVSETDQVRVLDGAGNTSVATITVSGTTPPPAQLYVDYNYGLSGYPGSNWIPVVCLRSGSTTTSSNGWGYGAQYNGGVYYYFGDNTHSMNISWHASYDNQCGKPCIRWSAPKGGWVRNEDGLTCNIGVFWNQLR